MKEKLCYYKNFMTHKGLNQGSKNLQWCTQSYKRYKQLSQKLKSAEKEYCVNILTCTFRGWGKRLTCL